MSGAASRLTALLGCERAVLSAPMLGCVGPRLVTAVARAGGVGMMPCSGMSDTQLDSLITHLSGETSNRVSGAVGYNFFCHQKPEADGSATSSLSQPWCDVLAPFFSREGVSKAQVERACATAPDTRFNEALCRVLLRHAREGRARVVSFHFGLPDAPLWAALRDVDGLVLMCTATTVAEAAFLAKAGADVIICQGAEAGGHRGSFLGTSGETVADPLGLFALVPQVRNALGREALVVAAGGVVDARTAHAACVLGADGVQCGTAFLTAAEASTSALHRRAIARTKTAEEASLAAAGTAEATLITPSPRNVTNILTGRPARGIVNGVMAQLGCVRSEAPPYPMATPYMSVLRSVAEKQGRDDYTSLWAGQNLTGCQMDADDVSGVSAIDIVERIARGL